jgi:peptide/nickel transport system ATP-binding protein
MGGGGEKQRAGIARAIAGYPGLVLCDEPISSLDVSVQASVLDLLLDVQKNLNTTMIFITHDLSVVRYFCDDIAVMYLGKFCEIGPSSAIYDPPYHPYTEALLSAVPVPDPRVRQKQIRLGSAVPSALNPPGGCRFHTRCSRRIGRICEEEPPLRQQAGENHWIYCHIPLDELSKIDKVLSA